MKIVSIQIGPITEIKKGDVSVATGIFKNQIRGKVRINKLGIENDHQADLSVHGGIDKAVYAYSLSAYSWWKTHRPQDIYKNGAFGENLTVDDIQEQETFIGDTFSVGSAILQVSEPRFPCFKLGLKFNDPSIIKSFVSSRRPGIYFRVLQEGSIEAGDEMKLVHQEKIALSILELFEMKTEVSSDRLEQMLQVKALPERWRKKFLARLAKS